jgi:indole-3-glycerol phosphate synthase
MGFLSDLVAERRQRLDRQPLDDAALMARAMASPPPRDFVGALKIRSPAVIAEIKRASPSAGTIAERDPSERARAYAEAGASAISVLTEPVHFHGSLADLRAARLACELPILRKDFLLVPAELIESRAGGADAVLLIAACLSANELAAMIAAAGDLGLDALVETHADGDVDRALEAGAQVIGVNARDLETLEVDVDRALEQLRRIPEDRVRVMESGISSPEHVRAAVEAGASAILVGEALMRADDPRDTLEGMIGGVTR